YAGDITMVLPHGGQVLFGERHELKVLRRNTADTAWEGDVIVSHSDPNFRWTLRSPGPDGWDVGGLPPTRSELHRVIVARADAGRLIATGHVLALPNGENL